MYSTANNHDTFALLHFKDEDRRASGNLLLPPWNGSDVAQRAVRAHKFQGSMSTDAIRGRDAIVQHPSKPQKSTSYLISPKSNGVYPPNADAHRSHHHRHHRPSATASHARRRPITIATIPNGVTRRGTVTIATIPNGGVTRASQHQQHQHHPRAYLQIINYP
ncbi:hypothetical protein BC940DRAFT_331507 [Gongronella butleri]|nr:hypothetical protein BC940DRAFT_331507 [Gongronella butleri]